MLFSASFLVVCDECMCGPDNRKDPAVGISLNQCMERCVGDTACNGIEYWSGDSGGCYECLDPGSTSPYTDTESWGYPPSVFKRGIK